MSIKIAYCSDLHFELHIKDERWLPPLPGDCDVMVLAGDIGNRRGAINAVERISAALPSSEIVFVAGNHEYYKSSIDDQITEFKSAFEQNPRVHFLENNAVHIAGVRFLGCTLWSGFDALGAEYTSSSMEEAQSRIADFRLIRRGSDGSLFRPVDAIRRYQESRAWLEKELTAQQTLPTIVVSHFPPVVELRHKKIPEGILTNYFQANCKDLVERHQPVAWIYGHNHYSDEVRLGKTLICSNQLGYPYEEEQSPLFDSSKIITVSLKV